MGIVAKSYTFSAGGIVQASEHNSNFDTLYTLVNGNIDNDNIKANAGIVGTKLATITTPGKVNITALVATNQATGDIIYASSATVWARLGIGSTNKTLTVVGGLPAWA